MEVIVLGLFIFGMKNGCSCKNCWWSFVLFLSTIISLCRMRTYTCLIVEDSDINALLLKEYLTELALFDNIVVCESVNEASVVLLQQSVNLIFLDVELKAESGLELLTTFDRLPPVIVVSAHERYAVDCFDLNVADYLKKPYTQKRLLRGIKRALGLVLEKEPIAVHDVIFLKIGRRLQKFPYNQIDYIEAFGIYCKIHYQKQFHVVNETISTLESRLPTKLFRRVQKSFIINLTHVTSYNQNNFYINDKKIRVSAAYRED
jgi:two-component system, LytTR family, response regulator LytT